MGQAQSRGVLPLASPKRQRGEVKAPRRRKLPALTLGARWKRFPEFSLPGTCLGHLVRVHLYKLRRSCAVLLSAGCAGQGWYDLFQFGCRGVKSFPKETDKSCAHAAKYLFPRSQAPPGNALLEALPPVYAMSGETEPRRRGFPGRAWEPEQMARVIHESRNGLIHRFTSRKAFLGLGLCAARQTKTERE